MGQKVNPIIMRVTVTRDWLSKWFANKKDYAQFLLEDQKVREFTKKRLEAAAVPKVFIERYANRMRVTVHTARPGLVIGRKGAEIDKLKEELAAMTGKEIYVDIVEVKQPETDAQLIAENVALQLERRISYRRAMKKAVQTAMSLGVLGIRINCGGRLGGAEIARRESYREGKLPLHDLRADIDYGFAEANTVYGKIGVKVWVCRGVGDSKQPAKLRPPVPPSAEPSSKSPAPPSASPGGASTQAGA